MIPDFPADKIPSPIFIASVHIAMMNIVQRRDRIEADLQNMAHDQAAYGSPQERRRWYRDDYQGWSPVFGQALKALRRAG